MNLPLGLVFAVWFVLGTSLGFRGPNFVQSSDNESVRSDRLGLRTSVAKSDFATRRTARDCGKLEHFSSSNSELTQNLGSTGYLVDLSDF